MPVDCPCPRGLTNCEAISNIVSDDQFPQEFKSFFCVGYNETTRAVHQDRFRQCWFTCNGTDRDDMSDNDRRDFIDMIAVISRALSVDENIRVHDELTDEEMNDTDLISIMRHED